MALNKFFEYKQVPADQYFDPSKTRDVYVHDVTMFSRWLEDTKKMTPKSIRTYCGAVVSYLLENNIEMPRKFWSKKIQVGNFAVTEDATITREILQQILAHSDVMGRTMFLMSSSSGMRIEDILALTVNQIQRAIEKNPARIMVVQQKTRQKHYVFFSQEAVASIQEWLKVRESWLQKAVNHCHDITSKNTDDERLFPCHYTHAVWLWNKALEGSGYTIQDVTTKRHLYHIHGLRKYFRSQCTVAGVKPNIAEYFLGHIQGLSQYHQYGEDFVLEQYKLVEDKVRVFIDTVDRPETQQTIEMLKNQIKLLEDSLRSLMMDSIKNHPETWKPFKPELKQQGQ